MLALKEFRDKAKGTADLLNWSHLLDSGVVLGKDGSLLAGWFYRGPDLASSTDAERTTLSDGVNTALAKLGGGWVSWIDSIRLSAPGYPDAARSHFPDPISLLVDNERRAQFMREGNHYEGQFAIVVQYTPPLRRKSKVVDLIYDDDSEAAAVSPATRILEAFRIALRNLEDSFGNSVRLRRMESYDHEDSTGRLHLRDELVNYLHFCLTGEEVALNIPPAGAYLDTVVGGRELWPGIETFRLGSAVEGKLICCVAIEGFPSGSFPGILDALDHLPIPFRFSSRMIYIDQHEALSELNKLRRKWKQKTRGFVAQIFKTQGGPVNEDAVLMTSQTDGAIGEANSGLVTFGYYTPVVVLSHTDRETLIEHARMVARVIQQVGFTARIETINAVEAWLGSLPGHSFPNIRRPLTHTAHLADMLPLSGVYTGLDTNPCPLYPSASPPLLYAATNGATPLRINLHSGDVGHTLIFGPTGAGKSVLLATICIQALRYAGVAVWSFDYKRGMLATIKACGGRHYDIAGDNATVFCPLAVLDTNSDLVWAEDWIASCFQLQADRSPTPEQREAIHRAMLLLQSDLAPGARSFTNFVSIVQDHDVRNALHYYTLGGGLGGMLDAQDDSISFGRLMAFEMEDLLSLSEKAAIPVLLYLFRRFEKSLRGQPTYLLIDEAWTVFGHPVFREKLAQWLRITRSKNCCVVMATQNLSDANKAGILDILLQACPTKIFLANPEAETRGTAGVPGPRDFYEAMGLNNQQIAMIRAAIRKRHYYLVQPEGRRMFELNLGPVALAFSGATSEDNVREVNRLERIHGAQWPYEWLNQKGISYAQYA